jgi:hypothetical protein
MTDRMVTGRNPLGGVTGYPQEPILQCWPSHRLFFGNSIKGGQAVKHEKKLQMWMKVLLKKRGLNPSNWHFVKNTSTELVIVHKLSGSMRSIEK